MNHGLIEAMGNLPLSVYVAGTSQWTRGVAVQRYIEGENYIEQVLIEGTLADQRKSRYDQDAPAFLVVEQVSAGDAIFTQGGREYPVNVGDVYLFSKQGAHQYETGPSGVLKKQFVHIVGPALPSLMRLLELDRRDTIKVENPNAVARALRRAFELLARTDPDWLERLSAAAYELLVLLGKNLTPRHPPALTSAISFLELNLNRQLTLADLCHHTKLSSTHLNRLFKQYVGVAPLKYFAAQKLAWSQKLLSDSSMSIKEVAALVGYDDQLHFSAQFKKHIGVSPRAYRRQMGRSEA